MSIFGKVQLPNLKKSVLDLSYRNAFTCKFGQGIPAYIEEVVPGDKFKIAGIPYVNLEPLSAPFIGGVTARVHYFYVPYRIIWDDWKKFITGGPDGTAKPVVPFFSPKTEGVTIGSLYDFLNMGCNNGKSGKSVGLLWRAYWKIYNDYYRDANLEQDLFDEEMSKHISTDSGEIIINGAMDGKDLMQPFNISWRKDLFTSALPWAQRGSAVTVPLYSGEPLSYYRSMGNDSVVEVDNTNGNLTLRTPNTTTGKGRIISKGESSSYMNIEDLREANALQRWLERNAIAGGRYIEQILAHFGVRVPDYRLDRPDFIGGVACPITSSTVYQQSATTEQSVLGTRGGQAAGSAIMEPTKYFVPEHGVVIGIMSIRPSEAYYSQGIARMNMKFDKLDHYFPEFENLGEQEIKNGEIFVQGNDTDNKVFGYAPRYYEYKQRRNEVHGDFKESMAYWIPQRIFSNLPALNQDFIHVNPNTEESLNNIFAVLAEDSRPFQCVLSTSARYIRPMSKFSKFNF